MIWLKCGNNSSKSKGKMKVIKNALKYSLITDCKIALVNKTERNTPDPRKSRKSLRYTRAWA